jgi:hypothetical protein
MELHHIQAAASTDYYSHRPQLVGKLYVYGLRLLYIYHCDLTKSLQSLIVTKRNY